MVTSRSALGVFELKESQQCDIVNASLQDGYAGCVYVCVFVCVYLFVCAGYVSVCVYVLVSVYERARWQR